MRKQFIAVIAILLAVSYSAAQNVSEFELRYREALRKQQVDGDLDTAIKIYKEIAASKTADRPTKAKALLQLAACYETKGGQAERQSVDVYEQIVRDFSDLPASSQAKTKLAVLKPPAASQVMTLTMVKFGSEIGKIEATDGRRVVYWDSNDTTLFIGDKDGKTRTPIFKTTAERKPRVEVSRDLSMAFLYFVPTEQRPEVSYAIIKT